MNIKSFEKIINEAWNKKGQVNSKSSRKLLNAISKTIDLLDSGEIRVAEKKNNEWTVNQWIKKAILLSFRVNKMKTSKGPYAT
ncbi:MAG: 2,3,4,5-tetrahydropyridine-2,6-dicarboxylate N-succinyltransferase, partial [Alphaproteobacteria bacterium]